MCPKQRLEILEMDESIRFLDSNLELKEGLMSQLDYSYWCWGVLWKAVTVSMFSICGILHMPCCLQHSYLFEPIKVS
jgi:hypothetical protein